MTPTIDSRLGEVHIHAKCYRTATQEIDKISGAMTLWNRPDATDSVSGVVCVGFGDVSAKFLVESLAGKWESPEDVVVDAREFEFVGTPYRCGVVLDDVAAWHETFQGLQVTLKSGAQLSVEWAAVGDDWHVQKTLEVARFANSLTMRLGAK